jgi:hypothetical protein
MTASKGHPAPGFGDQMFCFQRFNIPAYGRRAGVKPLGQFIHRCVLLLFQDVEHFFQSLVFKQVCSPPMIEYDYI